MFKTVPVLIETGIPLILGFAPVVPTDRLNASIHPCVCKNNPSKGSPWPPKMHVRSRTISSYNTSALLDFVDEVS